MVIKKSPRRWNRVSGFKGVFGSPPHFATATGPAPRYSAAAEHGRGKSCGDQMVRHNVVARHSVAWRGLAGNQAPPKPGEGSFFLMKTVGGGLTPPT
jgi:hypothetical protein